MQTVTPLDSLLLRERRGGCMDVQMLSGSLHWAQLETQAHSAHGWQEISKRQRNGSLCAAGMHSCCYDHAHSWAYR